MAFGTCPTAHAQHACSLRTTRRLSTSAARHRPPHSLATRAHASLPSTRRRHRLVTHRPRRVTPSHLAYRPAGLRCVPSRRPGLPRPARGAGRRRRFSFGRCCCPYGSRPAQSDRLLDSPLDATKPNEARERDVSATFARQRPTRAAGDQRRRRGRAARGRDARTRTDISAAPPHELWSVLYIYIICMYDTSARALLSHAPPHGGGAITRATPHRVTSILQNPPTHAAL